MKFFWRLYKLVDFWRLYIFTITPHMTIRLFIHLLSHKFVNKYSRQQQSISRRNEAFACGRLQPL